MAATFFSMLRDLKSKNLLFFLINSFKVAIMCLMKKFFTLCYWKSIFGSIAFASIVFGDVVAEFVF